MALTRTYQFDALTLLHDGTAKTADGVGTEGILDLGAGASMLSGDMVVNITALDVATGDENYKVMLQGSSSASFASDVQTIAIGQFGHSSTLGSGVDVSTQVGVHVVPFHNHAITATSPTSYRYLRVYFDGTGATSWSIAAEVFLSPSKA